MNAFSDSLIALLNHNTLLLTLPMVLAGMTRGFSGFGAALVFVPLSSSLLDPKIAVVVLWMINSTFGFPMTLRGVRKCNWREMIPITIGIAIATPFGTWILTHAPIDVLRWIISLMVLAAVVALAAGWRRTRPVPPVGVVGVGMVSGVAGGIAGFYGPPVILFWVGGAEDSRTARHNFNALFAVTMVVGGLTFLAFGLIGMEQVLLVLVLGPVYGIGLFLGARLFPFASERVFRRAALSLCALSALAAMPLW
ncbi:MAG: sulfite exporter TauE/SafE family protein [Minwuia sp.]|nr:sulfite exporter TauE/SafE family protein [Minwuia sp.]